MEPNPTTIETPLSQRRPDFLKVLCILSFIGCGLIILMSLVGLPKLFQSEEMRMQELEQMEQISPGFSEKMADIYNDPNYTTKAITKFIIDISFNILTLIGVILMWKLRKKGFYIYVAAELLPYVTSIIFAGDGMGILNSMPSFMSNIAYVMIALVVIFDLAFIFMYSRNLKYMV
jgi:hypothetical protein